MDGMGDFYANQRAEKREIREEEEARQRELEQASPWIYFCLRAGPPAGLVAAVVLAALWFGQTCELQLERNHELSKAATGVSLVRAQAHLEHGFVTTNGVAIVTKESK